LQRSFLFRLIPALLLLAGFLFTVPTTLQGQVNLNETLKRWEFTTDTSRVPGTTRWKNKWSRIEAERNKSYITLNGIKVWLNSPITEGNGIYYIQRHDFDKTFFPIVAPQPDVSAPVVRRIVIDPGHGGKDPGMQNTRMGLNEKALTLDVARRLKFILEQRGIKVTLTRSTDAFVELDDRSLIAKRVNADLFVSIHFNSAGTANTSANGVETYILTPQGQYSTNDARRVARPAEVNAREIGHGHDRWNALLGYYLQATLVDKLDAEDRGLRRARFTVLKDLPCPGALIECGFLSNPSDATLISSAAYREKIAQGVADGVLQYQGIMQRLASQNRAAVRR
jgi:N-acetylmuramoyl-L-alanine amidase